MYKKNNFSIKLGFRLILIIIPTLLSSLFIVVIGVQLHFSAQQYLEEDFNLNAEQKLLEASQLLQSTFAKTEKCLRILQDNGQMIENVFLFNSMTSERRAAINVEIYNTLQKMREIEPCIGTIIFITDNGIVSIGSTAVPIIKPDEMTMHFGIHDGIDIYFHEPAALTYSGDDKMAALNNVFFFCVPIKYDDRSGYLCIVLRENVLEYLYKNFNGIAVASDSGYVYYNSSQLKSIEYETITAGYSQNINKNMLMHILPSYSNIHIFNLKNPRTFMDSLLELLPLTLLFILLILIFSVVVSGFLSAFVTKPLKDLTEQILMMDPTSEQQPAPLDNTIDECKRHDNKRKVSGQQIFHYLLITVLIPVITYCLVSANLYSKIVKNIVLGQIRSSFDRAAGQISAFFKNIEETSISFAFDDTICNALITAKNLPENLKSSFPLISAKFSCDIDIAIYDTSKQLLRKTNENMSDMIEVEDWSLSNQCWTINRSNTAGHYLSFNLGINRLFPYERIGYFKARVNEVFLRRCYEHIYSSSTQCYILKSDGQIISHPNEAMIGTQIKDSLQNVPGTFSYTVRLNENFYFKVIYDDKLVTDYIFKFFLNTIYLLIIILLVILITSSALSHYLVLSFQNFSEKLLGLNILGEVVITNDRSFIREINELNTTFHTMSKHIRVLTANAIAASRRQHELIISRQQAEFAMLQAQINPHFLYNTFESINFMIRMKDEQRAISMINSLSYMLRFVAKPNEQFVRLEDELQYAKMYVNIMKMRFDNMLSVSFDFFEIESSLKVIKFILQPIIENAIYHGIKPKGAPGEVLVSGEIANDMLIITVRDDGVGMSMQQLDKLNTAINENKLSSSIGLNNVHRRLRSAFGEMCGLTVMSSPGKGTVVTISHPCIR